MKRTWLNQTLPLFSILKPRLTLLLGCILLWLTGCQGFPLNRAIPSSEKGVYHTVHKNQTLYSIARAYNLNMMFLKNINHISDPTNLTVGTKLWIPGADRVLELRK
ncbi:MAG: LysM peptidoglycan-binding domain-containing protein [Nitrospinae bacterium]|nr:LysM peptidoglycan-binding domain-containing protein [Nitrospinota bacterium]